MGERPGIDREEIVGSVVPRQRRVRFHEIPTAPYHSTYADNGHFRRNHALRYSKSNKLR